MATNEVQYIDRYARNQMAISKDEQDLLAKKRVAVCGCGGIGGYVVEMLARIGVGTLVLIDCDAFEITNLNRQLLSNAGTIRCRKVQIAAQRVATINPTVKTICYDKELGRDNARDLLEGCDIVVDALDSYQARIAVEKCCSTLNIVLVHGAIGGWCAQVSTILPGSCAFALIYPNGVNTGIEKTQGNPAFTPAFAASLEVTECIKVLTGKGEALYGKLLVADLLHNTQRIVNLFPTDGDAK